MTPASSRIAKIFDETAETPTRVGSTRKIVSPRLMTHMVAGYPDEASNLRLAETMERAGVSFIEVQIPFSDPLADGPVIMRANHLALARGMNFDRSLALIQKLTQTVSIPIIAMSYYNLPFRLGNDTFLAALHDAGAAGVILPDIPYDEPRESYYSNILQTSLDPILVVSPQTETSRLEAMAKLAQGMIYTTLRVGITGAKSTLSRDGLEQFSRLRKIFSCPIAAGFGISEAEHLLTLRGEADVAVIGSHIISLMERDGLSGVEKFLNACREALA